MIWEPGYASSETGEVASASFGTTPLNEMEIKEELGELKQQKDEAKKRVEGWKGKEPLERVAVGQRQIELLDKLRSVFRQQLAELEKGLEIERRAELDQQERVARGRLPRDGDGRVSLLQLDALSDELDLEKDKLAVAQERVSTLGEELELAQAFYDKKERTRRHLKEGLVTDGPPTNQSIVQKEELVVAQLESRLAYENLGLRSEEWRSHRKLVEISTAHVDQLRKELQEGSSKSVFSRKDLQQLIVALEDQEYEVTKRLDSAKRELHTVEARLKYIHERHSDLSDLDERKRVELEGLQEQRRAFQHEVDVYDAQIDRLDQAKKVWNYRFEIKHNEVKREELKTWEMQTQEFLNRLNREVRLQESRVQEAEKRLLEVEAWMDQPASTAKIKRWRELQRKALKAFLRSSDQNLSSINRSIRLNEKALIELAPSTVASRVKDFLHRIRELAAALWNYELVVVEDRPITLRKIIVALILLFLGIKFSRSLSTGLVDVLLRQTHMDESAAATVRALLFYALIIFFSVLALYVAMIPLTLFAVMGGVLAIGLGFGSQNIINNFISGLILLVERPIRIKDMVEVEGTYGQVEQIGARCTHVKTGENIDIMVPNSKFLENNVVNWTLSSNEVRIGIKVGVVYGSPTRKVEQILREAVEQSKNVLNPPEPVVLFTEFGDNALLFEAHFWVRMHTQMDRWKIESEIRFSIDDACRASGVIIAFPQRDVHLDSVKPLEVVCSMKNP